MNSVRFFISIVFFFLSLLVFLPAPTNLLWKITIAITEWGHYLAILLLVPLLFPWRKSTLAKASLCITMVTCILLLYPVTRAYFISWNLNTALGNAFGTTCLNERIISVKNLYIDSLNTDTKPDSFLYSVNEGKKLFLDFYRPNNAKKTPLVLVIHGGGWDSGNNKQLDKLNYFLSQKGYAVAAINYRLAPEHIYPSPVLDTREAISFLKKNAGKFNIDATNIVLLGRSAGGQIALATAYSINDPAIKGVIAFYSPADMVWAYSVPGNPWILDSRKVLDQYLGGSYDLARANYHSASALEYVTTKIPPTLMIHGVRDELVAYEHNLHLKPKLDSAGVQNYIFTLPWATHGFDFCFNGPGSQLSNYAVLYFLKTVTSH